MLADSNGRGCSALLQDKLGQGYEVSSIVKPNGTLKNIVENIGPLTKKIGKGDCVIILGRMNDLQLKENYESKLESPIRDIVAISKRSNVIINAIPRRFDSKELDLERFRANKSIHKLERPLSALQST